MSAFTWVFKRRTNMSIHNACLFSIVALMVAGAVTPAFAGDSIQINLAGDRAYPESIAAAPDGTLYVSSPAVGGVWRIRPQSAAVQEWVKPGAFGSRSTLGVLVDSKANLLWVCSNDFSSSGIPGPRSVLGRIVGVPMRSDVGQDRRANE